MKVLILGGTGKIGSAIAKELLAYNHNVTILCRSPLSRDKIKTLGATALPGNIREPEVWIPGIYEFDGIIHAANTYTPDMGDVDTYLVDLIVDKLERADRDIRFLYTGGIWLFGDSKGEIINEDWGYNSISPFQPFADNAQRILEAGDIHGIVIHPANVVSREKPHVPEVVFREITDENSLQLPISLSNYWPVVTLSDLADLYRLALVKSPGQEEFIACSKNMSLSEVVNQVSGKEHVTNVPKSKWVEKYGDWVEGYFLNQKASSQKAVKQLGLTLTDI